MSQRPPIGIIGIGCRFPGALNPRAYWSLLREARNAIREVPLSRWDVDAFYDARPGTSGKMSSRWGGFLDGVDGFDAEFFGISPREARTLDPQQRLMLEVAWEALEDANVPAARLAGSDTAVYVGIYHGDYAQLCACDPQTIDTYTGTGVARALAANRLSYFLDLRGPSITVDTTCSSSLVAVHEACQSLWLCECELALAGGVSLMLSPVTTIAASQLLGMAADGQCKTFDARADGIVRGEGCGVVVLKPLAAALRDGDRVLAVIHGSAVNQDGQSNGLTAPSPDAQEIVVRRALHVAGLEPRDITFVETHGTGTPLGDPIEVAALSSVFGSDASPRGVALGAVKTNIGHLEAAAGIAALIKVVLCIAHGEIPANLHLQHPNPEMVLEGTRLQLPTRLMRWDPGIRRIAGVSSFSIGGTNAHVIIGEPPAIVDAVPQEVTAGDAASVVPISAANAPALRAVAARFADEMPQLIDSGFRIDEIARAAATGRSHLRHRAACVVSTPQMLKGALGSVAAESPTERVYIGAAPAMRPRVAFVFSGQGCQWAGMGRDLLQGSSTCRRVLEQCDAALHLHAGRSLIDDLRAADAMRMSATAVAQPLIFAVQLSLAAQLREWGIEPAVVVGHSLGEISAACVSGALGLSDAMRVIVARSEVMREIEGQGAMLAVDLSEADMAACIRRAGVSLTIAAVNAPGSVVVSGRREAVDRLAAVLQHDDVPCLTLPVTCAFHSREMAALGPQIEDACRAVQPADCAVPLVSTVTGEFCDGSELTGGYWRRNATEPVRFAATIARIIDWGASVLVEVAPHAVLRRDLSRCAERYGSDVSTLSTGRRNLPASDGLVHALASLFVRGCDVTWEAVYPARGRHVPLPTYPWQRTRHWHEPASAPARSAGDPSLVPAYEVAWTPEEPRSDLAVSEQRTREVEAFDALMERLVPRLRELGAMYADLALRLIERDPDVTSSRPTRTCARSLIETLRALRGDRDDARRATAFDADACAAALMDDFPECADELEVFRQCGSALSDILMCRVDPLEVLFGERLDASVSRLYRASPFAQAFNPIVADVVAHLASERAPSPVRILEIGAGTGGTTAAVLPVLPPGVHYEFTDVSPRFLARARREFACYPSLEYSLLDVEEPPASHGHAIGTFDIVIAANVLHATRAVKQSLEHAAALLKPGGVLVLAEGTSSLAWAMLTFGLTDGWWKFVDDPSREAGPLMHSSRWCELIEACGLRAHEVVPSGNRPGGGAVLIARKPRVATVADVSRDRWLVLGEGAVGEAVANGLRAGGAPCTVWERERRDLRPRVAAWRASAGERAAVVHAWSLAEGKVETHGSDELEDAAWWSAGSVVEVVQGLTDTHGATRLWVVTDGELRGAAAIGASRVIAAEHPELWGGLVEVAAPDAARIVAAVAHGADGEERAWRGGAWHVARLRRRVAAAGARRAAPVHRQGSYLITGGLGGVGLAVADWLVSRGAGRVVLASRHAADPQHAVHLSRLRARGTEVWTRAVDVTDAAAVRALVADSGVRGLPLRGVVHAAGVVDDALVARQDWPRMRRVLAPKMIGAWHVHAATEMLPLDWFALFGSAASLLGMPGLASYAAANAFLDALAHYRRSRGLPAVAIDWSGWDQTGMAAAVGEARNTQWRARGLAPMTVPCALAALDRALTDSCAQLMIADIDWRTYVAGYPHESERRIFDDVAARPAGRLAVHGTVTRRHPSLPDTVGDVNDLVTREIRRSLMLDWEYPLPEDAPLTDIGVDSLMAIELRNALARATGLSLPSTLIFEHPTIGALVAHLASAVAAARPVAS